MLSLAGTFAVEQRARNRSHRMRTGADVAECYHRHVRSLIRLAAHRGEPGKCLAASIISCQMRQRPGLAKARNRAHYEARVNLVDYLVVEAQSPDHSRCVILDEDIDLTDQVLDQIDSPRLLQIQTDT